MKNDLFNYRITGLVGQILLFFLTTAMMAQSPPEQPKNGPGGNDYPHNRVQITQYGTDIFDWYWIIQPVDPKPDSAEVIVFFHGTNSNPDSTKLLGGQDLFLRHIAKMGYTVIYPLYQYGGRTLPFGPQLSTAANVVNLALHRIDTDPNHIPARRWPGGKVKIGVTGISRGGGMSINFATHSNQLNLPTMDAVVAFVPGKGRMHHRIDPRTKVVIVSAEEDETNGPLAPINAHQQAWDSLYRHPCENKEYFIVHSDDHGMPNIVAKHDCHGSGSDRNNRFRLNALDFFGSWKWSVGTFNCQFRDTDCRYVFGKDSIAIYMGRWSDGTLVNPSAWVDPCQVVATQNFTSSPLLFPNPARDVVEFPNHSEIDWIRVIDLQGRLIMEMKPKAELPISHLKRGMYHIQMHFNNQKTLVEKLVKL